MSLRHLLRFTTLEIAMFHRRMSSRPNAQANQPMKCPISRLLYPSVEAAPLPLSRRYSDAHQLSREKSSETVG